MGMDEFKELLTDEGTVRFIAQHTRLDAERVARIYRLGSPWPLGGEELDFGRQAEEAGLDVCSYMASMAPLLDLDVEQMKAKLEAFEQALARGESPDPIPELENPILAEHLERVTSITNEPRDVVDAVFDGLLARLMRLGELARSIIGNRAEP